MILERGSHVLVVHRRLFDGDKARFFIGRVDDYDSAVARITGHTWVQDTFNGKVLKKEGARTKILSLSSGTLIVYALPNPVDNESIKIDYDHNGRILVSDGKSLKLDLSEGMHGELRRVSGEKR
jgi:hypothetical protein